MSAASTRAGSSSAVGTAYGMRAVAIFFFARVIRAAIVDSADEERVRDVRRRDAAHEPQRQRDLRLARQRGMAAGEDEPQPVVGDPSASSALVVLRLEQQRELRLQRAPAAQEVEREAARDRREPRAGARGDAVARPGLERADVGVLHRLLGGVEVARHAHRRGEHVGPLAPVRVGDRLLDRASVVLHDLEAVERPDLDAAVDDRRHPRQRERVVEVAGLEDVDAAERSPWSR